MTWVWIVAGIGLGLIAGSFIATLVVRWPEGRRVDGRSACDACGETLRWFELAPLLSYLAARGRCRRCNAPISRVHPICEALCAIVGALALGLDPGVEGVFAALAGWLLIALAIIDLREFWLPDALTGLLAVVSVASAFAGIDPLPMDRLIGGAAGFLTLWLIAFAYRRIRGRDGLGGGDPKLFGAIGLWLGWESLPFVLLLGSLIGLMAVATMMARGTAVQGTTRLPFGSMLAAAAFLGWTLIHAN
ncbi:MAG: A24 family peptidase [Pseudomonadota bacterium]